MQKVFTNLLQRRHTRNSAGFTLVELLTVVSIVAVLSIVGVSVLVNSQIRGTKATTLSRVRSEGVFLVDQVSYALRGARYVVENQAGDTCTNNMTSIRVRQFDGARLELALSGTNLVQRIITDDSTTETILNSTRAEVSNLVFDCQQGTGQSGALIKVTFDVQIGQAGTDPDEQVFSQTFSTQISIRSLN